MNLIPEWKTNTVILVLPNVLMEYYSEYLTELDNFYANFLIEIAKHDQVICLVPDHAHAEKMVKLTNLDLSIFKIANIEDIWIRDLAPIQSDQGYIKFIYNPDYDETLDYESFEENYINHLKKLINNSVNISFVDLKLDGGNFIHNGKGTAIMTEKLYHNNPHKTKEEVNQLIKEKTFIDKLVVVPTEPGDITGHIDGMLQWIDSDRILINDYHTQGDDFASFAEKLDRCLEQQLPEVEKIKIPYFPSEEKYLGWYDEKGNYMNFLMTQNRVYAPIYNQPEDEAAQEIYTQIFGQNVSFIESGAISRYGGMLHCITWNYLAC
ncbi:MAG: agmatine deiminase family protein [Cyanobacteriota bacterium]|nr:agmatine deiminase family protein [Cyanobacteriota bacterium]